MRLAEALDGVSQLYLDTAPVVYFVERNPQFEPIVDPIFNRLDQDIIAVISPITLAECLMMPRRLGLAGLEQLFWDVLDQNRVMFVEINRDIAQEAIRIRTVHNLSLLDALQVGAAIRSGCDALLTNDMQLKRGNCST